MLYTWGNRFSNINLLRKKRLTTRRLVIPKLAALYTFVHFYFVDISCCVYVIVNKFNLASEAKLYYVLPWQLKNWLVLPRVTMVIAVASVL